MKKIYNIDKLGNISIEFNAFTGRYNAYLDGKVIEKSGRRCFIVRRTEGDVYIDIIGNIFSGTKVAVFGKQYEYLDPTPWYGYILSFIPIILSLILGNISELAYNGFYYVGGMIGGFIGGLFTGLCLYVNAFTNEKKKRLLLYFLFNIFSFLICYGVGNLIVIFARIYH